MASRQSTIEGYVKVARKAGWRVKYATRHYRVYPPDKTQAPITLPITPGSDKAVTAARTRLRSAGLDL